MANPASVGHNTEIIDLCESSDDERMPASVPAIIDLCESSDNERMPASAPQQKTEQQDNNDSDPDNDAVYCQWKRKCICSGHRNMCDCDCGATPGNPSADAQSGKDYDDEQVSKKQIPAEGNGGAAVSALGKHNRDDEVVPAFSAGKWHHDVYVLFKELEKDAKLKMDKLDEKTLNALKQLPYEVALLCLGKVRDEDGVIRNMNQFIVKNAAHLRNQWGLDDAASSSSSSSSDED